MSQPGGLQVCLVSFSRSGGRRQVHRFTQTAGQARPNRGSDWLLAMLRHKEEQRKNNQWDQAQKQVGDNPTF